MAKRTPRQALTAPMLDALEEEIQRLRVSYERFFLGIDRMPPERARTQVERTLRRMTTGALGSTALRFRLDGLRGRFVTYNQHWRRVCRQIEQGSYVRVVAEAERRRRLAAFEARVARERANQEAASGSEDDASSAKPPGEQAKERSANPGRAAGASALGPPGRNSARAEGSPGGPEIAGGRVLYEQYVQARRAAGQSTQGLSYAAMMQQISRQMPKIQAQHGGPVRFEVATQNGRVRLLAKPEKG